MMTQVFPVFSAPFHIRENYVADAAVAVRSSGNSKPMEALGRLNAIAAAPVARRELYVIEVKKQIDVMDDVEIALPRNVAGLKNSNFFHGFFK